MEECERRDRAAAVETNNKNQAFFLVTKAVGASFFFRHKSLCFLSSLLYLHLLCLISLPLATCAGGAPLSVVCTEDIKCPAFTEEPELLLDAGVLLLSQRLRQEIRRYLRAA